MDKKITKKEQIIALRQRTAHLDRYRAPWTQEELHHLQEMFDDAVDITDMALILQRSELAILNQVKDMYRRVRPPKEEKSKCKCPQCQYYRECQIFSERKPPNPSFQINS